MFSDIARHFEAPTNRLYRERDRLLNRGGKIVDLISGNVTAQGIYYPEALLRTPLVGAARPAKTYHPDPSGQRAAREAVAQYYRTEGLYVPYEQILLTPGTSTSYWYAFKILANSGEETLCPCPSYPLFES